MVYSFCLKYLFSNTSGATAAEGNPDEEKIGAFGVGERQSSSIDALVNKQPARILQLVFSDRESICVVWRYDLVSVHVSTI